MRVGVGSMNCTRLSRRTVSSRSLLRIRFTGSRNSSSPGSLKNHAHFGYGFLNWSVNLVVPLRLRRTYEKFKASLMISASPARSVYIMICSALMFELRIPLWVANTIRLVYINVSKPLGPWCAPAPPFINVTNFFHAVLQDDIMRPDLMKINADLPS